MFLGTPLRGAPSYILADALVTLNGFVGRKPEGKIIECLSRYNKELLQTLEDFKQKSNGFETFCFVETKKSYKV